MFNLRGSIAAGWSDHCQHTPRLHLTGDQRWQMVGVRTHKRTPARSKNLVNRFVLLTAGPCSDTLTLPLSGSAFLPPAALAPRLPAASDVDRMCVTRDRGGVSAMWTILITSIITYWELITCLLLENESHPGFSPHDRNLPYKVVKVKHSVFYLYIYINIFFKYQGYNPWDLQFMNPHF